NTSRLRAWFRLLLFCLLWFFFFFSSRRRHTRFSRDWSSDVCSSDLPVQNPEHSLQQVVSVLAPARDAQEQVQLCRRRPARPRLRSEERRVGKSVDLGGRRIVKNKKSRTLTT